MRSAEHDAGPIRDKSLRGGEPETAAAAGHKVKPVTQSKFHPDIAPGRWRVRSRGSAAAGQMATTTSRMSQS